MPEEHASPILKYFIPSPLMLVGIQNQTLAMGSIIKDGRAYKKNELDPHFITITDLPSPVDPFSSHLPPEYNRYHSEIATIAGILYGTLMRMSGAQVYPFTGISVNDDGSFHLHGLEVEFLE